MVTARASSVGTSASAQALTPGHQTVLQHVLGELGLDRAHQPVLDGGHADLADQVVEEAVHDEAAGLLVVDAAGAEVEQLLVVEAGGGAGVAGPLDLAGLDLQVGDRVGLAAVAEHEVAVLLVGLDALGDLADQHVADPHGVGALALERALVHDVALGARGVVVGEEAVLDVLAGVGEVEAEQLGRAAGTGVRHVGVHADDVAAEAHRHVLVRRVAADAASGGA